MKITPGFWRQRNGDKVEIISIDHAQKEGFQCLGRGSGGHGRTWNLEGIYNPSVTGQSGIDLVAPWEEPKLRPWTRDEFPHWCAIRRKQGDKNDLFKDSIQFATTLVPEGCYIARSVEPATWQRLLESYEHSTDGGKTWHPCGVLEGGAK